MQLSNEIKITKVKAGQATGTSAVNSDVIDMQGYEGVIFFGTIATANAGNYLKAQQDSASGMGTAADLAAKKIVATADGEVVWLDIYRPAERYLRAVIIRGVTTVTGDIYALRYKGRKRPEDNTTTDVILGELLVSPDEGAVS
jgi:hypothetical protein